MTEVIMPKMGDGMEEGTLVEWLKADGDKVRSGEVIGNIQTDKATLELESPGTGTFTGILIEAGATVPVGVPIAAILKDGESLPADWGKGGRKKTAEPAPEAAAPAAEAPKAEAAPAAKTDGRIKASPLARKIAAERGIDLAMVAGSGPGGRIVEKDVTEAPVPAPASAAPAKEMVAAVVETAEDKDIILPVLRKITAKRTTESKQQVPHFYVTVEVDVERIHALRDQFESEASGRVSINDFVVKATALALAEMPEVNATFLGDRIRQFGAVHVGIAVALPDGLTVPVIRNAHGLTLRQISAKAKDLVRKAKENKLGLDELQGSTFSISNMGMLDVENFVAIVNQPNAGILAIASARKKVVVSDDDEIEVRWKMNITGSFDHRVVDGAVGARFVNLVKAYLENPTRLLA